MRAGLFNVKHSVTQCYINGNDILIDICLCSSKTHQGALAGSKSLFPGYLNKADQDQTRQWIFCILQCNKKGCILEIHKHKHSAKFMAPHNEKRVKMYWKGVVCVSLVPNLHKVVILCLYTLLFAANACWSIALPQQNTTEFLEGSL